MPTACHAPGSCRLFGAFLFGAFSGNRTRAVSGGRGVPWPDGWGPPSGGSFSWARACGWRVCVRLQLYMCGGRGFIFLARPLPWRRPAAFPSPFGSHIHSPGLRSAAPRRCHDRDNGHLPNPCGRPSGSGSGSDLDPPIAREPATHGSITRRRLCPISCSVTRINQKPARTRSPQPARFRWKMRRNGYVILSYHCSCHIPIKHCRTYA